MRISGTCTTQIFRISTPYFAVQQLSCKESVRNQDPQINQPKPIPSATDVLSYGALDTRTYDDDSIRLWFGTHSLM